VREGRSCRTLTQLLQGGFDCAGGHLGGRVRSGTIKKIKGPGEGRAYIPKPMPILFVVAESAQGAKTKKKSGKGPVRDGDVEKREARPFNLLIRIRNLETNKKEPKEKKGGPPTNPPKYLLRGRGKDTS